MYMRQLNKPTKNRFSKAGEISSLQGHPRFFFPDKGGLLGGVIDNKYSI